ncbi:hypothetical protein [Hyalangium rubrum]|uniref:Lipoprotein n=1 Tax=Hyalangium rubrum TaxID=3103134 RepID=A0ABU5HD30_9BACT|nr:hypothetical protein [Hyalangium sp. s54d21]MDY7231251.1 hypothetical protein [Hyalangium sp. s54d21]
MKRSRFVATSLALVGLLGAAEVRSAAVEQQRRLEEFRKQSLAQRKSQGLDKDRKALYAKYPTPEVKLAAPPGGGGDVLEVPVGTEATLVATGRIPGDAYPHLDCVGVEVLSHKVTEGRLEVRVKVSPNAMPGTCEMRVFSPVSLAYDDVVAFRKVGAFKWDLALANGMKARLSTSSQKGSDLFTGTSEWFSKDGKSLGTRQVNINTASDKNVVITVQRTQEEMAVASQAATEAVSGADSAQAQKEMMAVQQQMQKECMSLPSDKMAPCLKKYSEQMKAASQKMREAQGASQKKADAAMVGCQSLRLDVAEGKASGKATGCGGPGEVAVTGTVTAGK